MARDLAIEEGRRRERVDGVLHSHEARLDRINGSIDRTGQNVQALTSRIGDLAEQLRTREKLDEQRAKDLEAAKKGMVSRAQLWLAATAIAAPQLYQLLHGSH